jgi:hypothetical protein
MNVGYANTSKQIKRKVNYKILSEKWGNSILLNYI